MFRKTSQCCSIGDCCCFLEGLTNGDVALDDLKGGPCGRPLTSDSAVTPLAQAHQDTAPVLTPDPMVGTTGSAGMPGGAGTAVSPHGEVTAAGLQSMDQPSTVAKLTVPLSNGFGESEFAEDFKWEVC